MKALKSWKVQQHPFKGALKNEILRVVQRLLGGFTSPGAPQVIGPGMAGEGRISREPAAG